MAQEISKCQVNICYAVSLIKLLAYNLQSLAKRKFWEWIVVSTGARLKQTLKNGFARWSIGDDNESFHSNNDLIEVSISVCSLVLAVVRPPVRAFPIRVFSILSFSPFPLHPIFVARFRIFLFPRLISIPMLNSRNIIPWVRGNCFIARNNGPYSHIALISLFPDTCTFRRLHVAGPPNHPRVLFASFVAWMRCSK